MNILTLTYKFRVFNYWVITCVEEMWSNKDDMKKISFLFSEFPSLRHTYIWNIWTAIFRIRIIWIFLNSYTRIPSRQTSGSPRITIKSCRTKRLVDRRVFAKSRKKKYFARSRHIHHGRLVLFSTIKQSKSRSKYQTMFFYWCFRMEICFEPVYIEMKKKRTKTMAKVFY
jgi:hypothetical protein